MIPSDVIRYLYDSNVESYGLTYNGNTYLYVKNLQGDVIGILDELADIVCDYHYDAWGQCTISIPAGLSDDAIELANKNPIRYRGYYYDTETELYYLQSRYYNPEWGRFVNGDGYASTGLSSTAKNMFAYCLNNPVNYSDPSGCFPEDFCIKCKKVHHVMQRCQVIPDYMLNQAYKNAMYPSSSKSSSSASDSTPKNSSPDYDTSYGFEQFMSFADASTSQYIDDVFEFSLSTLRSPSVLIRTPNYISNLAATSSSIGVFSLLDVGAQMIWDYQTYSYDAGQYLIASAITLGGMIASVGVATVVTASGAGPAVGFIVGVGFNMLISDGQEYLRGRFLKEVA